MIAEAEILHEVWEGITPAGGASSLVVEDLDRSLDFYVGKLGLEVKGEESRAGVQRTILSMPASGYPVCISECPSKSGAPVCAVSALTLGTDDVHAVHDTFVRLGVEFDWEPTLTDWRLWSARFLDPDGNRIYLYQYAASQT